MRIVVKSKKFTQIFMEISTVEVHEKHIIIVYDK